ncbi:MAG: universal stress protein [Smithellaceae bacterium]|jgi:nucleotide-binding universal stress UspA family protein|nr:universal stress protein [Smithellaceae bacterium]MDD3259166.1 universal stress protein [Smithellaceae bacterium]MDD3848577.1 universal stress protein [Smithellaceae bacterium]HOG11727.1 universal stress protein [Smithellaceae bacterium]HOQ71712.1 universal stress protein [Smithellaceae bacterium]
MRDFKNILYAMDLDGEHFSSMVHALEFARRFTSRIHILYVNDPQAGYRHPADHEDAVALKVKEAAPEFLLENLDVVYAVSKGDTAGEIVQYARENLIDLIIVGHKHRGKLYASMFDSTDVHVIDEAMLPILVFPEM